MKVSNVYYKEYNFKQNKNNTQNTHKEVLLNQADSIAPRLMRTQQPISNTITFRGIEDVWGDLKDLTKKTKESVSGFFSKLFKNKEIKISDKEASLIENYLKKENEIKEEYDKKIANIKDGFWDIWINVSEKKRDKLRKEKEKALKVAYTYQDIFEEREKHSIEETQRFYELARQLNLSKEVLIAFENAQAASRKRLEIINNRKIIMNQKGFSQIGGYNDIKNKLQVLFIDKLDDEKAGKYLVEPIPNAIMFFGPTGCGKTTFANALAQEADCNIVTIQCRGSQKEKEKQLYNKLEGYTTTDEFGDEVEVPGILQKSQKNFLKTQKRTIVVIDEFDRFFGEGVSNKFINAMKGILESCSEDYHVTFLLTSNKPQKIPYELRNSHRISPSIPMAPPTKLDTVAVIEHYLQGCQTEDIDYNKILDELFKFAPDEKYSNTHLKAICEIATDEIKPENVPLSTEMILEAIKQYDNSTEDHNLLRITKDYLNQFENDKANI